MISHKDSFGNKLDLGDLVLRDTYGGGFAPRPFIVVGSTPARIKIARTYTSNGKTDLSVFTVDPDKTILYDLIWLKDKDRQHMIETRNFLADNGMLP